MRGDIVYVVTWDGLVDAGMRLFHNPLDAITYAEEKRTEMELPVWKTGNGTEVAESTRLRLSKLLQEGNYLISDDLSSSITAHKQEVR